MKGFRRHISLGKTAASNARISTSNMFIPTRNIDLKQVPVASNKWLLQAGLIRQSFSGGYHMLPLAQRVLEKLIALVDKEMIKVGGAKMAAPILMPAALWKKSERWSLMGGELFRLSDQQDIQYCLGPTHEEAFTDLVQSEVTSYQQLPLKLYQIDRKFRDELRPRYGLLRAREFWMKDMYSFDLSEEQATESYDSVCGAYDRIFQQLDLPVQKVRADSGNIGGSLSHEYHVITPVGEDSIYVCERCGGGESMELIGEEPRSLLACPQGRQDCPLHSSKAIEVAHAFFLGTKYSSIFNAIVYKDEEQRLLQMGCYGIGISRLIQALVEFSLMSNEGRMVWPRTVAPFSVCIVPLAKKKDSQLMTRAMKLYDRLQEVCPSDVVLEDRTHLSIGKRLKHMKEVGYPLGVVLGEKAPDGHVELHVQCEEESRIDIVDEEELVIRIQK